MSAPIPYRPVPQDLDRVTYAHGPDSHRDPGVREGSTTELEMPLSDILPGTRHRLWVHVPPGLDAREPAGAVVFLDGGLYLDPEGEVRGGIVLDALHHQGAIPPTLGIFVDPGERLAPAPEGTLKQRNVEYDAADDTFARFLVEEVLAYVAERHPLLSDPTRIVTCGGSSGGDAAFTAAWHRPDVFGTALCFLSSFAQMPGGNPYPELIRAGRMPDVRVLLQMGHRDLGHDQPAMNWLAENLETAAALARSGADVRLVLGDGGHSPNHGGVLLPDALRWALAE